MQQYIEEQESGSRLSKQQIGSQPTYCDDSISHLLSDVSIPQDYPSSLPQEIIISDGGCFVEWNNKIYNFYVGLVSNDDNAELYKLLQSIKFY
jgi:hypothetical protein